VEQGRLLEWVRGMLGPVDDEIRETSTFHYIYDKYQTRNYLIMVVYVNKIAGLSGINSYADFAIPASIQVQGTTRTNLRHSDTTQQKHGHADGANGGRLVVAR
jgi:hypothetical protein